MNSILFLCVAIGMYVSCTTAEFSSMGQCEAAKTEIVKAFNGFYFMDSVKPKVVCVAK